MIKDKENPTIYIASDEDEPRMVTGPLLISDGVIMSEIAAWQKKEEAKIQKRFRKEEAKASATRANKR